MGDDKLRKEFESRQLKNIEMLVDTGVSEVKDKLDARLAERLKEVTADFSVKLKGELEKMKPGYAGFLGSSEYMSAMNFDALFNSKHFQTARAICKSSNFYIALEQMTHPKDDRRQALFVVVDFSKPFSASPKKLFRHPPPKKDEKARPNK